MAARDRHIPPSIIHCSHFKPEIHFFQEVISEALNAYFLQGQVSGGCRNSRGGCGGGAGGGGYGNLANRAERKGSRLDTNCPRFPR